MRFTEHEFVEFFGIVGSFYENAFSYTYTLSHDGLRLDFTIFPRDDAVYTSIYRDGVAEPIISSRLEGCTHARFIDRGSRHCLEIGRPGHATSEPTVPLVRGLRLFLEPHFRVELSMGSLNQSPDTPVLSAVAVNVTDWAWPKSWESEAARYV
jgi:hypothetical protein